MYPWNNSILLDFVSDVYSDVRLHSVLLFLIEIDNLNTAYDVWYFKGILYKEHKSLALFLQDYFG